MVPVRNPPLLRRFSGNPNPHVLFLAKITPLGVEIRVRCPRASSSGTEISFRTKSELNAKHHCPF